MGFVVLGENFGDVAKQAQRHGRIGRALVLEKKVEQGFALAAANGEEQVGMDLLQAGFDERAGQNDQRRPVDFRRDGRRQVTFEKRGGVLGLRKNGLEKPVVGVSGGDEWFCGRFHRVELR